MANESKGTPKLVARTCALCGKSQSEGESLVAISILTDSARSAGIALKNPTSKYLSPGCAQKVRAALAKAEGRQA